MRSVDTVDKAIKQCPDTKVVLSGYSQGAQLVHNSAKQLSSALTADISSGKINNFP